MVALEVIRNGQIGVNLKSLRQDLLADQIRRGNVTEKEELRVTPNFLAEQLQGLKCH